MDTYSGFSHLFFPGPPTQINPEGCGANLTILDSCDSVLRFLPRWARRSCKTSFSPTEKVEVRSTLGATFDLG